MCLSGSSLYGNASILLHLNACHNRRDFINLTGKLRTVLADRTDFFHIISRIHGLNRDDYIIIGQFRFGIPDFYIVISKCTDSYCLCILCTE